jgi:hypothetical protein
MPDFLAAAKTYFDMGYTCIPLVMDGNGLPKRPISPGWSSITHDWDTIERLPWTEARGLGLVLGEASDNLAAIDIDDVQLAQQVHEILMREYQVPPRMMWTARGRLHVFCREPSPSRSTAFNIEWHGQEIGIELKATGTQVATWPSPGYTPAHSGNPWPFTLDTTWHEIARCVGLQRGLKTQSVGNYPPPWQDAVPKDQRNKAIYREAHQLREAGVPLQTTFTFLKWRFDTAYEQGDIEWHELERTIQSAYVKGVIQNKKGPTEI